MVDLSIIIIDLWGVVSNIVAFHSSKGLHPSRFNDMSWCPNIDLIGLGPGLGVELVSSSARLHYHPAAKTNSNPD